MAVHELTSTGNRTQAGCTTGMCLTNWSRWELLSEAARQVMSLTFQWLVHRMTVVPSTSYDSIKWSMVRCACAKLGCNAVALFLISTEENLQQQNLS